MSINKQITMNVHNSKINAVIVISKFFAIDPMLDVE